MLVPLCVLARLWPGVRPFFLGMVLTFYERMRDAYKLTFDKNLVANIARGILFIEGCALIKSYIEVLFSFVPLHGTNL